MKIGRKWTSFTSNSCNVHTPITIKWMATCHFRIPHSSSLLLHHCVDWIRHFVRTNQNRQHNPKSAARSFKITCQIYWCANTHGSILQRERVGCSSFTMPSENLFHLLFLFFVKFLKRSSREYWIEWKYQANRVEESESLRERDDAVPASQAAQNFIQQIYIVCVCVGACLCMCRDTNYFISTMISFIITMCISEDRHKGSKEGAMNIFGTSTLCNIIVYHSYTSDSYLLALVHILLLQSSPMLSRHVMTLSWCPIGPQIGVYSQNINLVNTLLHSRIYNYMLLEQKVTAPTR